MNAQDTLLKKKGGGMSEDKLLEIDKLAKNIEDIVLEEQGILFDVLVKTKKMLSKSYNYDQEGGSYVNTVWKKADLVIKVDKYNVAVSLSEPNKINVVLIVYKKQNKSVVGKLAANGWKECRQKVTLNQIIDGVICAMAAIKSQINAETEKLINSI